MNVIAQCRFCNAEIVFLKTRRVFGRGNKPIPTTPKTLSLADWRGLVLGQRVEFNPARHRCHLDICPDSAVEIATYKAQDYFNSYRGCAA
jgi:hypothetical protein